LWVTVPSARLALPGLAAPSVGFEAPFEMLNACHERLLRTLGLLERLQAHVRTQGADWQARQAATDVLRYFDLAAPLHHEDEELHVFPVLLAQAPVELQTLVRRLQREHVLMAQEWQAARQPLQDLSEGRLERFGAEHEALFAAFAARQVRHLHDEEQMAYPYAQAALAPQQQAQMGAEMAQRRGAR
jgi:hemerythrin-like domain-containing protein